MSDLLAGRGKSVGGSKNHLGDELLGRFVAVRAIVELDRDEGGLAGRAIYNLKNSFIDVSGCAGPARASTGGSGGRGSLKGDLLRVLLAHLGPGPECHIGVRREL